jgi:hypothetical protein
MFAIASATRCARRSDRFTLFVEQWRDTNCPPADEQLRIIRLRLGPYTYACKLAFQNRKTVSIPAEEEVAS